MVVSILASVLVVLLIFSARRMRRRERRRDSIARFADAREAMSITQGHPAVRTAVMPHPSEHDSGPPSVVVRTGSDVLFDPLSRRRVDEARKSYRGDPEMLARRPTVAMLPTLLASRRESGVSRLSPGVESDADASAASMPMPKSEAS
jgi:hypothetical protein